MRVDGNIGGGVDGSSGGSLEEVHGQVDLAVRCGLDAVWSTEVSRDPFLPLVLAAARDRDLQVGTAVTVAFARSPMTTAMAAHDLQSFSQGRLLLGLGSQVAAHITRRFSMPWSAPAARMREYVCALRAIWQSWQDGTPLSFRGDFYEHSLMPPLFRPDPHPFGAPPVLLAAVGPRMTEVAGEVADGLLVHAFSTPRHLREVTLPQVREGLQAAGRRREDFTVCWPGLVATGADERSLAAAVLAVRHQVAFYGATPAYRGVLDLHGWGELHEELHRLSREGDWTTMTELVDDEILAAFAVVGEPDAVGAEVRHRVGHLVDRYTLFTPYPLAADVRAQVVQTLRDPEPAGAAE